MVTRVRVSTDEGYARWAAEYDAYPNALVAIEEPIVRRLVGPPRGLRALDVACGTGRHACWLASEGAIVTGVDRSSAMLEVAQAKGIATVMADVTALPFADGSFDVVVTALMLDHLLELGTAFDELTRVLAPGGQLCLSTFHPAFHFKGVRPHFLASDGNEYELPVYPHLPSTYVTALQRRRLTLEAFEEPIVDDALVARFPAMGKHLGLPLAIVITARRG